VVVVMDEVVGHVQQLRTLAALIAKTSACDPVTCPSLLCEQSTINNQHFCCGRTRVVWQRVRQSICSNGQICIAAPS